MLCPESARTEQGFSVAESSKQRQVLRRTLLLSLDEVALGEPPEAFLRGLKPRPLSVLIRRARWSAGVARKESRENRAGVLSERRRSGRGF